MGVESAAGGYAGSVARLVYKPLGLIVSVLGGVLAGAIFKRVWGAARHEDDAPKATDRRKSWGEVIAAAPVQGAVFGGIKAAIDRGGATGFEWLTGAWPGKK